MKQVLFLTNYPSPYRVRFFDELAQYAQVTVLFADRKEKQKHRNADWYISGKGEFQAVQLKKHIAAFGRFDLCVDVLGWLKREYDAIVVCGYSNPTMILAMLWMRLHRIPFYMEVDGGLIRQEGKGKYRVKKTLVGMASQWLSTGDSTTRYLTHYGAKEEKVYRYPFSSLYARDIREEIAGAEEKQQLRKKLGIKESRVILSIGQFIPRKGFDVLMHSAVQLPEDTGVYIVGGEATEDYYRLREELGLSRVHFLGFQKKENLADYYRAADLFVLPTREDIWGLVINEAMAYGLPVVTTDRCVAGLTLVEDGVNGYLVPIDREEMLAQKLDALLAGDHRQMGCRALETIRPYTIENMAAAHVKIFEEVTV